MNKYTLYVGLNDQTTKKQEIETAAAFDVVTRIICKYADGGTVYTARGIYKHDSGAVVIENTLRIEIFDVPKRALNMIVKLIKRALNQESVALQTETVTTQFI